MRLENIALWKYYLFCDRLAKTNNINIDIKIARLNKRYLYIQSKYLMESSISKFILENLDNDDMLDKLPTNCIYAINFGNMTLKKLFDSEYMEYYNYVTPYTINLYYNYFGNAIPNIMLNNIPVYLQYGVSHNMNIKISEFALKNNTHILLRKIDTYYYGFNVTKYPYIYYLYVIYLFLPLIIIKLSNIKITSRAEFHNIIDTVNISFIFVFFAIIILYCYVNII